MIFARVVLAGGPKISMPGAPGMMNTYLLDTSSLRGLADVASAGGAVRPPSAFAGQKQRIGRSTVIRRHLGPCPSPGDRPSSLDRSLPGTVATARRSFRRPGWPRAISAQH